ncbi:NucA/NucB deoxyribonuclease domain-containing protein [Bacillus cytotoxicus]|uniref:DNA-entry nuclease NucA n=2 Tax=Bacillus cytotoxicus TaxID=580165 RepID=A0AAX2CJT0_9BACI|nr:MULTISPECIES: NucA/NucB deoxyribonuclease domain-containing protein [Bacillus cereus group]ABS22940.1 putative competence-specific nuclease [Bacillus cytotoxicus NVH 391-98]AWC29595.1 DNA-entry nuclease [Bacillus cytotoxicus]AWC33608.1 DNA-entry nuclease [Bacillus cytotoxicus]AWC37585.1 DNA-entry nuclease [Bacillus cytotoxicus]AWC41727.1 DNA-entry nuclease [Bacillus cytotoxicus]
MKQLKGIIISIIAVLSILVAVYEALIPTEQAKQKDGTYDQVLEFPKDRYPETGKHIENAIKEGHSKICTIDRNGAGDRRKQSLAPYPPKKGYDRDEWPMAMCKEGGKGAHIEYISPADNRGAGSWVGNKLDKYQDGTRVKFVVK